MLKVKYQQLHNENDFFLRLRLYTDIDAIIQFRKIRIRYSF